MFLKIHAVIGTKVSIEIFTFLNSEFEPILLPATTRTTMTDFSSSRVSTTGTILINSSKLCLKKFCQMLLFYFFLNGYSLQIYILLYLSSIVTTFPYYFSQVLLDFIFVSFVISILFYIFFSLSIESLLFCAVLFSFFFLPANILSHLSSPIWTSLVAQTVKNLPTIVWSLDGARSPVEGNGNPFQYSFLEIPWTEEPGRLQSMGSPKSQTWLSNQIEPQ